MEVTYQTNNYYSHTLQQCSFICGRLPCVNTQSVAIYSTQTTLCIILGNVELKLTSRQSDE